MEKISATIYDILGYLIPGFLCILSFASFASLFTKNSIYLEIIKNTNIVWQFVLAYTMGHIVQSIVSLKRNPLYNESLELSKKYTNVDDSLINDFNVKVEKIIGKNPTYYSFLVLENNIPKNDIIYISTFRALQGLYKGIIGVIIVSIIEIIVIICKYLYYYKYIALNYNNIIIYFLVIFFLMYSLYCINKAHDIFLSIRIRSIINYYLLNNQN